MTNTVTTLVATPTPDPENRESLDEWRLRVLQDAEDLRLVVPLTGPNSVATPWAYPQVAS